MNASLGFALGLFVRGAAGCGGERVRHGTVTFDGQPVQNGIIVS